MQYATMPMLIFRAWATCGRMRRIFLWNVLNSLHRSCCYSCGFLLLLLLLLFLLSLLLLLLLLFVFFFSLTSLCAVPTIWTPGTYADIRENLTSWHSKFLQGLWHQRNVSSFHHPFPPQTTILGSLRTPIFLPSTAPPPPHPHPTPNAEPAPGQKAPQRPTV